MSALTLRPGMTAVITGAGSGFGLELARLGAEKGLNLVLTDVQQDALDAAVTDWPHDLAELDDDLQRTLAAWRQWSQQIQAPYAADPLTSRSADA